MSLEEKERAMREFEKLVAWLEEKGVEYSVNEPSYVLFDNVTGECMVFPSQTFDGKLVAVYQVKERHDTAEEVLKACGLITDE